MRFPARTTESAPIFGHSIRSSYGEGLLFAALILHDLGLGSVAPGKARFELEGADLAAALLSEYGVATRDIDRVWEAIAPQSTLGIAERRGLLAYLTQRGVFIYVGHESHIPLERLQVVRHWYPRPAQDRSIRDAIIKHASQSQAAAPPHSIGAELLRQRRAEG